MMTSLTENCRLTRTDRRDVIGQLLRQARSIRLQASRSAPQTAAQLNALAADYEARAAQLDSLAA